MQDDSTVIRKFEETLRLTGRETESDPQLTYRVTEDERSSQQASLPGEGFELLEEIGRGGMGVVFRARQKSLGRDVAVKKVQKKPGKARSLDAAFVAEARVTGILDHPNIVPVHQLGTDNQGETFLAMKLVGGRSWKEILQQARDANTPEVIAEQLEILISVCHALSYAHNKGIIHRDLKPSNVMVGEFGEVFVMDWGLSVAVDGADIDEDSGIPLARKQHYVVGTPAYMAPEMAQGAADLFGPWTDVYLLGAILCEILTKRAPHAGDSLIETVVHASKGLVPELPETLPLEVRRICLKAMAKNIDERYQTVEAFREDLKGFLKHRESSHLESLAQVELSKARKRLAQGEQTPGIYGAASEAIAGFRQALLLWPQNEPAKEGLNEATIVYADAATRRGDFVLARTQADLIQGSRKQEFLLHLKQLEAEREAKERQRARLKRSLIAAVGIIVVGLTVGLAMINGERRRADANAEKATREAKLKSDALRDVIRLADVKKVIELKNRVPQIMRPTRASLRALEDWLNEAKQLEERLSRHESRLAWLKSQAVTTATMQRSSQVKQELRDIESLKKVYTQHRSQLKDTRILEVVKRGEKKTLADELYLKSRWLEGETPKFDDFEMQWQYDTLVELIAETKYLLAPEVGLRDQVVRYAAQIASLKQRSIDEFKDRWESVAKEVKASAKYNGLELKPQPGLVPLGADPDSGLQEFLHVLSHDGPLPNRNADGRLRLHELTGIIFVLLPGGETWRGAQSEYPQGFHFDQQARDNESPVHTVDLDPFLISKYELTQGQWLNMFLEQPSFYKPSFAPEPGQYYTLLHPLESVSWQVYASRFPVMGVLMPTEAQWEYAARGGTKTPWWTGSKKESLDGAANIPDQAARRIRANWETLKEWPDFDDGWGVHAPVNIMKPNPFGLHHVIGNVAEMCRDRFANYDVEVASGDGAVIEWLSESRMIRGGAFDAALLTTRSAAREYIKETEIHGSCGVRPSLKLLR